MPAGSLSRHGLSSSVKFILFATLFTLFYSPQPTLAVQKNITIDDQNPDSAGIVLTYTPAGAWANQLCEGCAIHPDPQQLHNGTATSATLMPEKVSSNTLDFDFNGTAIYIYFTLFYNEGVGITVKTECNFTLDNEPRVFFNHSGDPTKPVHFPPDYNTLVYSKTGLAPENHHMTISMSDVNYDVFLSFDYALYTVDEPLDIPTTTSPAATTSTSDVRPLAASTQMQTSQTPSPDPSKSSGPSPGIIVGGVVGGLAVLTGFILLLYFYRRDIRRSKRPASPGPTIPRPFLSTGTRRTPGQDQNGPPSTNDSSRNGRMTPSTSISGILKDETATSAPSSSSGSRSGQVSVERRIRAATRRMQSLREEIASNSGRTSSSRNKSGSASATSRETRELIEEVKRLRQEIQSLKEMQNPPARPPQLQPSTTHEPPPYTAGLDPV